MPLIKANSTLSSENISRLNPLLLPLPWIVVLAVLVIFSLINYNSDTQPDSTPQNDEKPFPHFYLTEVNLYEFNAQGNLQVQMNTPLVRHFQPDEKASPRDFTLFASPHIIFAGRNDRADWDISASEGRSEKDGNLFILSNNVVATQQSDKQGLTTITTSELQVNSREQFAHTDKAVTMRTAKTQLNTVGLHADIQSDRIKLLSNVKGSYEP